MYKFVMLKYRCDYGCNQLYQSLFRFDRVMTVEKVLNN